MPSKALKVHTHGKAGNPPLLFFHAFPFSGHLSNLENTQTFNDHLSQLLTSVTKMG